MKIRILLLSAVLSGCGVAVDEQGNEIADCWTEINNMLEKYGDADDHQFSKHDFPYIEVHAYSYWCEGFTFHYKWGEGIDGCETSTTERTPGILCD